VVSLRATNYEAHNRLQVCDDVISTLPQEAYSGHFQFCELNVKLLLCIRIRERRCMKWMVGHTTGEKSPGMLDGKERGPQCGVEV
jgi:hypothetical protein